MINYSYTDPRYFPIGGSGSHFQIDRVQGIDPTETLNRDKKKELGTDGTLGYVKKSSSVAYRMTALENGEFDFFLGLANKASSITQLTLNDFKTAYGDIGVYLTDDEGTFKGTILYPSLRLSGFSLGVADPQADIIRTFDLVGESAIVWKNANQYYVSKEYTVPSATDGSEDIVVNNPVPVADPDDSSYFYRIVRVRAGVVTELTSASYTYTVGTNTLSITGCQSGDVIKYYYTASTYISGSDTFTTNTSDKIALIGDCVSAYIGVGDYMYELQNLTVDVKLDRQDNREIGNKNIIQRGVNSKTVNVSFSKLLNTWTIEEALRGQSATYGKIDIDELSTDITFYLKVYSDNTKGTFKWGMKCATMSPTESKPSFAIDAYGNKANTLEGESMILSTVESDILS